MTTFIICGALSGLIILSVIQEYKARRNAEQWRRKCKEVRSRLRKIGEDYPLLKSGPYAEGYNEAMEAFGYGDDDEPKGTHEGVETNVNVTTIELQGTNGTRVAVDCPSTKEGLAAIDSLVETAKKVRAHILADMDE